MSGKLNSISFNLKENVKVSVKGEYHSKVLTIMKHLKYVCQNPELIVENKNQYMYFSTTNKFGVFEDSIFFEICSYKEMDIIYFLRLVTMHKH